MSPASVIIDLRKKLNLTQAELAKMLDLSQASISLIEQSKRFLSYKKCCQLIKIAKKNNINLTIELLKL
jgi:transcriptional regulator with XRE-family HTH domain